MRLAFWRRPAEPTSPPAPLPAPPSVQPPPVPPASEPPPVPPELEHLLRALWRDDPVGVEVAAQAVTGRGLDASITAQVAAHGVLSAMLARDAGIGPGEANLLPETLARLQAQGERLVQLAGPLLPRFAPQADDELARFCVLFASGGVASEQDSARLEVENPVQMMRVACLLLVLGHRPAPLEDLVEELRSILGG